MSSDIRIRPGTRRPGEVRDKTAPLGGMVTGGGAAGGAGGGAAVGSGWGDVKSRLPVKVESSQARLLLFRSRSGMSLPVWVQVPLEKMLLTWT